MMKEIIYTTNNRINEMIKEKHIIPYVITSKDIKYEANRWYYNAYWGSTLRVISVKYDHNDNLEECYIKWEDGCYGLICTELEIWGDLRLEKDHKNIAESNIINDGKSYTGAEIIYWFFINEINCFNKKYKGFWKFVDGTSDHRISDYAKYRVVADEKNGNYINCRIIKIK